MDKIVGDLDYWTGIKSPNYWYNTVQHIGEGGSSHTYQCIRSIERSDNGEFAEGAGNTYVIKFFTSVSKDERKRRFLAEREFLKETDHPSILKCLDSGTWNPDYTEEAYPFYVSEYMPTDLNDVLDSDRPTPIPKKVSYAVQLLSALVYLEEHDPPIVHRDIKPRNIFFSADSCVLADFGAMREGKSQSGVVKNSSDEVLPSYSSIDMFVYEKTGEPITHKSNVFQLGVVLTELFTGIKPISIGEDSYRINTIGNVLVPESYPNDLGSRLKDQLNSLLRGDPDKRPSARDVIEEWRWILKDCTEGQEYKIR